MSKFLTGKDLEEKLTDIIWDAKKHIVIVSPFIKLDNHVRSIFDKIKATHEVHIVLVFGKNEDYKQKSFNKNDFDYFKEFKNISILYNKDLHAKHYCNEKEGLITSLNLYDYSMVNNIEYGVCFSKSILNVGDKLFEDTEQFTYDLMYEKSILVYRNKPVYKSKIFGLTKSYQNSTVQHDISNAFFNDLGYPVHYLKEFIDESLTDVDKIYSEKPQREKEIIRKELEQESHSKEECSKGYCIRTGEEIPFDPERPMCYSSWKTWNNFGDYDYGENYCHKTGKKSWGKTSMGRPIL